jgi:(E)-2-((N-methylformamido)methylene)succinate hydrolase
MTWTTQPRSNFAELQCIERGCGPSIVLIHGVGLRAEAWNAQITALSQWYRVQAVDMPGHGESDGADLQSLAEFTDAIAAGIDFPALVMGHSMGAMIALDLASRYRSLVTGVVALNAIFQRSAEAAQAVQARASELDGQTVADPSGAIQRWFGVVKSAEADACQTWLTEVNPAAYQSAYRIFAHEDGPAPDRLAQLDCPALFLTGSDEPNSTPLMSKKMAALCPAGEAQIIADAAHMMPMTHPNEVNNALQAFAQRVFPTLLRS